MKIGSGLDHALKLRSAASRLGLVALIGTVFSVTPATLSLAKSPTIGGCPVFPADSIWNTPINRLPVDPRSRQYVASIGADKNLHPDFASGKNDGAPIGIPFIVVPMKEPKVKIVFRKFGDEEPAIDESDPGPYPIPRNAPIEGGPKSQDDRHVIVVQEGSCTLFELYKAVPNADGSWSAVGAARFDLEGHELRPDGWTSADAAGLPIFPGLVRAEEVAAGEIKHALRFTAPRTRKKYVWPARHFASVSTDEALPPLGQYFRLRANFDISKFSPDQSDHPSGAADLRNDPGGQWFALVSERSAARKLERRSAPRAQADQGLGFRGRGRVVADGGTQFRKGAPALRRYAPERWPRGNVRSITNGGSGLGNDRPLRIVLIA